MEEIEKERLEDVFPVLAEDDGVAALFRARCGRDGRVSAASTANNRSSPGASFDVTTE